MRPTHWRRWILGGLAIVMLANSGCLAAAAVAGAAAAGGTAGYMYLNGNVRDDFNAELNICWAATKLALADLRLPITHEDRTEKRGTLVSKSGTGDTITLILESRVNKVPADGPITSVNVRVGTLGDEKLSGRVLEQIAQRLYPAPPLPQSPLTVSPSGNGAAPAGFQTAPPPLANSPSWNLQK
jgi:hypothetical protein